MSTLLVDDVVRNSINTRMNCAAGIATGITPYTPVVITTTGTVTIGSGSGITNGTDPSPINIYFMTQVAQIVYTKAEINAAGATGPFTIQQLGWYIGGLPSLAMPNYTIKLKHVTVPDVSSALGATEWTTVRTISSYLPATLNVYDLITLTTPFTWNGVDNIGLELCWDSTGGFTSTGQVQFTTSVNGYRYSIADSTNYCGTIPSSISPSKPNIRMVYG